LLLQMVVHRLSDISQKKVPNCGNRHLAGITSQLG
jgi:hypothetical protein